LGEILSEIFVVFAAYGLQGPDVSSVLSEEANATEGSMKPSLGLVAVVGLLVGCSGGGRTAPPLVAAGPGSETTVPGTPKTIATDPTGNPQDDPGWGIREDPDYAQVISKVAAMVSDPSVTRGASRRGLSVMNVSWEDTGRAQGSSLGPNITDLTLQVRRRDSAGHWTESLMPVIRFPNFTDRTGDVKADKFFMRVGNEKQDALSTMPLTDILKNPKAFLADPRALGTTGSLLAPRDTHFLVSAQAVFLPIPKAGKAEFNPVVFNYQSAPSSPAVLTILVTREGASMRVIENRPEDRTAHWGQELYFNNKGQKTAFTAERRSDVAARIQAQGGPKTDADRSALARGADVLFLVQVPLVHQNRGVLGGPMADGEAASAAPPSQAAPATEAKRGASSDVEQAVLGHGPNLGPYREGWGTTLVRDARFPIRITVQFYKATSNGVVSEADLDGIARSIGGVMEHADFVGSLVIPNGDPRRPTAWQTVPNEWFPW
jgi:hypothetical protein